MEWDFGLVEYSKMLLNNGVTMLAVANVEEAEALRQAGIQEKILMLTPTRNKNEIKSLIQNHIILTIGNIEELNIAREIAKKYDEKIEAQLKGNQIISGRVNVVNVDSEAPTITSITQSGKSGNGLKVNITAKDNLSGLNGIYFNTVKSTPNVNASGWIEFTTNDTSSKTYSKTFSTGTYYVYVKDKAGNISASSKNGITISNATYHSERWYCPSGYTSSGSGSSMRCSKTVYTNAQYHAATTKCTSSSAKSVYSTCAGVSHYCGVTSTTYTKVGNKCYGNWVNIKGKTVYTCDGSGNPCHTTCGNNYDECDESKYNENDIPCSPGQTGMQPHYPTNVCRNIKSVTKTPAYYSCSSGTLVGTRCKKTTTTSPYHQSAYYSCSSGTLVGGNMCFQNN